MVEISGGRPDILGGDRGVRGLVVQLVLAHAVGRCEAGNPALRAHGPVAHADVAGDLVNCLCDITAVGVAVGHHALAACPAQEIVDRQAGDLALDVPQRSVDRGDRAHRDRAAPPVRAAVQVLPGILDARRIPTDQRRNHVFGEVGGDGELAAVERRIADAGDAFVGLDLQRDEIAAGTGDDDAGGGDLHARIYRGPVAQPLDHSIAAPL